MGALDFDWSDPKQEPPNAAEVPGGGGLVYVTWMKNTSGGEVPYPYLWHWCPAENHWKLAGTASHELVSQEPLHLEPSLHLPECCGLHGFIRGGEWVPA